MSEHRLKHEAEAKAVGLTIVGAGRQSRYRAYQFNDCDHVQEFQLIHVRNNNFRCQPCFDELLDQESKSVGLTIVGAARTSSMRKYSFNDCKHEQEISTSCVRANEFSCRTCFNEKLKNEAKEAGLTLLGPGKTHRKRIYQFNDCKHEQEVTTSKVRDNVFQCKTCLIEKLTSEAEAVGLTFIGPGKDGNYRKYRFNDCNHKQNIHLGGVRSNIFHCATCFDKSITEKLNSEAAKVGLTLLGPGKDCNYRIYKFNDCKHEQEITISGVRINSFTCQVCEDTSRTQPSNVYLLKIECNGFSWLKYGYAKTVETRTKQYGLSQNAVVQVLASKPFDTGNEANEYENSVHALHGHYKLDSEDMKQYHTSNGFNECYPISMQGELLESLNEVPENVYAA